jgi:hypothetical protein
MSLQLERGFPDESPARERLLRQSLHLTRQVSALHDKSLPHTRSLRLASDNLSFARAVPASDQDANVASPRRTSFPAMTHGKLVPHTMQTRQLATCPGGSDESLNAALFGCAALDMPSHPTLRHANSDRSTRVPPTFSAGLRLGPNVASSSRTEMG